METEECTALKRLLEALLFAAVEPLTPEALAQRLGEHAPAPDLLHEALGRLQADYAGRGVELRAPAGRWAFRTAPDLGFLLRHEVTETRRLGRGALEVLAIIAYRQPVTRGDIEAVRGVSLSKDTLDRLLETGWVRPGRRRDIPGKPLTYVTTETFLDHFGLEGLKELPGLKDMREAGLLDTAPDASLGPLFGRADEGA